MTNQGTNIDSCLPDYENKEVVVIDKSPTYVAKAPVYVSIPVASIAPEHGTHIQSTPDDPNSLYCAHTYQ